MAIDTQKINAIESLVQGIGSLMAAAEYLGAVQTLIGDAELTVDPPTNQELLDNGYDWFEVADISAALTAVTNARAIIEDAVNRVPMNTLRKQI